MFAGDREVVCMRNIEVLGGLDDLAGDRFHVPGARLDERPGLGAAHQAARREPEIPVRSAATALDTLRHLFAPIRFDQVANSCAIHARRIVTQITSVATTASVIDRSRFIAAPAVPR